MTKRVFITGASSGIGRALALAYAEDGASLCLLGRDAARLEGAAAACRAAGAREVETHVADVRDQDAMSRLVTQAHAARPIDVLVANAGVATGLGPGQLREVARSGAGDDVDQCRGRLQYCRACDPRHV